jgi:aspartate/methionine/tyrosine aminotransferase
MLGQQAGMLNQALENLGVYASKSISQRAKSDPTIVGMSLGEPFFGPPDHLMEEIVKCELTADSFLDSFKRYENSKGSIFLRKAIADWYLAHYNMSVDYENEIIITHGGIEAIVLSILCVSEEKDYVAITDPSYMLYERCLRTLGRVPVPIVRDINEFQYESILDSFSEQNRLLQNAKALIINSPENPSGYILSKAEWEMLEEYSNRTGLWVIHDEVYDTMVFDREHFPFRTPRSIIINSFSKKFGIPGIRIGWMIADKKVIELASKLHDYLYLGVNILSEKIAARIIAHPKNKPWLNACTEMLKQRVGRGMNTLSTDLGYTWSRKPHGGMFLFPNVTNLYSRMPSDFKDDNLPKGDAVANYLIERKKVAVVPGSIYGKNVGDYVRLVLCNTEDNFNKALSYLSS